jgi:hypothetical protein
MQYDEKSWGAFLLLVDNPPVCDAGTFRQCRIVNQEYASVVAPCTPPGAAFARFVASATALSSTRSAQRKRDQDCSVR